jgi:hypothetical protein
VSDTTHDVGTVRLAKPTPATCPTFSPLAVVSAIQVAEVSLFVVDVLELAAK